MRKLKVPNTFVLLFILLFVVAGLSWILPSGQFDTQMLNGKTLVVPGTFHVVDANRQGLASVLMAFISGFEDGAEIIGFVLIVGGVFGIFNVSGMLDAGIRRLVSKARNSATLQMLLIPIFMMLFSLGGAVFGMSEEVIPFVLIFVPIALSLGYDSVVGVAIPFVGAHVGFAAAFMNPFTLQVAQGIAELPPMSGFGYRVLCWFLLTGLAIGYVLYYAARVRKNPELSPTFASDQIKREKHHYSEEANVLESAHVIGLTLMAAGFGILIYGVLEWGWYIKEISAVFLSMGIVIGLVSRLNLDAMVKGFLDGAKDLLSTALVIALAKGLVVLANDGRIIHTILNGLSQSIAHFHPIVCSQLMFLVQTVLNFFVPSGSGQAALTMPIMAPLGDLIGVARQTSVLAFQFGDGFSNMIIPTSGVCMGALALGEIPWEKWVAWIWKLQVLFFVAGCLLLIPTFYLWVGH